MADYYNILGVKKGASKDDIKQAYRSAAKKYHPDVNKDADAEARFREISEAYAVLSDDDMRSFYDTHGTVHRGAKEWQPTEEVFSSFRDFFRQSSGFSRHAGGLDVQTQVEISVEDVFIGSEQETEIDWNDTCQSCSGKGCKPNVVKKNCSSCGGRGSVSKRFNDAINGRGIHVEHTCSKCNGQGKFYAPGDVCETCKGRGLVDSKNKIKFKIPRGVHNGASIRAVGMGLLRTPNGQRGSLFVVIAIKPHDIFEVEGYDIFLKYPLTLSQAIFGDNISIPTLHGVRKAKIRKGTQSGMSIQLGGLGLPRGSGSDFGSMIISFEIETPDVPEKLEKCTDVKSALLSIESEESLPMTYAKLQRIKKYLEEKENG